jgi:hypothetical protein
MPGYGAAIASQNAIAVLRFLLDDFSLSRKYHKQALVNYLQMAIDLHGMANEGMRWKGDGGHGNGRKLPILFASHVLGKERFLDVFESASFSEDEQVYYSEKISKALFGKKCSDEQYWMTTRFGKGSRDCRDPYGFIDGGGHEIGAAYQSCCTAMPWKYTALAVRLLRLDEKWMNMAFFDYVDRWVNQGVWASPDPCAPYNDIPGDYKKLYGPTDNGECIKGEGRYKDKHVANKDAGHYRDAFGDQMWRQFRYHQKE